ncbi:hypothetical protein [Microbulbifer sp. JTAC008]|uniref:hypothetical protein n=1 Tax=unclassified Microbulbifer TaxID=2619833 RepID=UPI004039DDE6
MIKFLVVTLSLVGSLSSNAEVFSCELNGVVIYTDDRNKCGSEVSSVHLVHKKDKRVNYRYPERKYEERSGAYSIFIESPQTAKDEQKLSRALDRLSSTLEQIFNKIPVSSHNYLKDTDFYIMLGPESEFGGEKSGLRYFPKNGDSTLLLGDRRWSHAVVIYNVDNFLWLPDLWVNKSIMHELAHAWHYEDWPTNYRLLKDAWVLSRQSSLYLAQEDVKGRILEPAYASKNEKEYFSELSAIYFVGGNYYPFNRTDLKKYDPKGYAMIERIWGL